MQTASNSFARELMSTSSCCRICHSAATQYAHRNKIDFEIAVDRFEFAELA